MISGFSRSAAVPLRLDAVGLGADRSQLLRHRRRVGLQPGAGLANGHPSSSLNGIEYFTCSGEVSRRYAASLAVEAFVEQNLPS